MNDEGADLSAWGLMGQVGFIMLIALGLGLAAGIGLDNVFGMKPFLTLTGATIGFALGIAAVYRVATQAAKRAEAAYERRRKLKKAGSAQRAAIDDDDDD
jgi:F0F1-type ATP synthase assembly protein I